MKKFTLMIIAFAAFAFAGCTATRDANTSTTNTNAATNGNTNANKTAATKPAETPASTAGMDSPTATMSVFFEALKKKDNETVKKCLSKTSLESLEAAAKSDNKTIDQLIADGEDMSRKKTPAVRNEKIDGAAATLEVEDEDQKKWDTVPFVKEDGAWKIAYDKMQS